MINPKNLIFIESAMEVDVIVSLVEQASRSIWHRIPDVTSFEHTCYVNIGMELAKGNVKTIEAMARYYISRAIARHIKKTKYVRLKSVEEIASETDSHEDAMGYEPRDVLANVESGLEIKEAITLLAKGDRKRRLILTEWANGSTNDSELSDTLASVLGGQARSHRKFIQRFRIECQTNYYSMAI